MGFTFPSIALSFPSIAVALLQNRGVKVRLVSSDKDATNVLDKQSDMHVQLNDAKANVTSGFVFADVDDLTSSFRVTRVLMLRICIGGSFVGGSFVGGSFVGGMLLEQWLEDCYWTTLQEYVADVKHAYVPHIDITTDIDEDECQQMENLHCKLSKQE